MSTFKSVNALKHPGKRKNCFLKDGVLTAGYKTVDLNSELPIDTVFAVKSKAVETYFVVTSRIIYKSKDGKNFEFHSTYGCKNPFLVEDYEGEKPFAAIVSNTFVSVFYEDGADLMGIPHRLTCGVMHCGRLFGADGYVLRWSGTGGIGDWKEGINGCGYLLLDRARGKVLNLLVYDGKLIAVRENGLTVFKMYGSPENFSVDGSDFDCYGVYSNTACIVGGKLFFYSKSGLRCFDGNKITAVETGFTLSEINMAVSHGDKYFLACYNDDWDMYAILCYDVLDGSSCIVPESADLLYVSDGVRIVYDGEHKLLVSGGAYSFESAPIDFGTDSKKTVTKVKLSGKANIGVSNGKYARWLYDGSESFRPHLRGKKFVIIANGKEKLEELTVTAEVTDAI